MAHIVAASAERTIGAPAHQVYQYLADMQLHSRFLPPPFYDFQVEERGDDVSHGSGLSVCGVEVLGSARRRGGLDSWFRPS